MTLNSWPKNKHYYLEAIFCKLCPLTATVDEGTQGIDSSSPHQEQGQPAELSEEGGAM